MGQHRCASMHLGARSGSRQSQGAVEGGGEVGGTGVGVVEGAGREIGSKECGPGVEVCGVLDLEMTFRLAGELELVFSVR